MSSTDPYLARVFSDGVQIAYKRHKNIRDILCRAKLPPVHQNENARPKRIAMGFKKCNNCTTCIYSENTRYFKCSATGESFEIKQPLNCLDTNVIYVVCCRKCRIQYVGKTTGTFRARMDAHRCKINGSADSSLASHFKSRGHNLHHFLAFPVEKVHGDQFTILARERYWINKLDVIAKGLNTNRT